MILNKHHFLCEEKNFIVFSFRSKNNKSEIFLYWQHSNAIVEIFIEYHSDSVINMMQHNN